MKTDKDLIIELNNECADHLTTIKILKDKLSVASDSFSNIDSLAKTGKHCNESIRSIAIIAKEYINK